MCKRLRVILSALVLVAVPIAAKPTPTEFEHAVERTLKGERALQSGRTARAEQAFEDALRLVPELPHAHLGLGHIAMARGKFEEALKHYRLAEQGYASIAGLQSDFEAERWNRTRRSVMELDDYLRNGGATNRIVQSSVENLVTNIEGRTAPTPTDETTAPPEIQFHLGNAAFALGRAEEAVAAWERCAAARPDIVELQYNLAIGYATLDRPGDALAALNRAEAGGFDVAPAVRERIEEAAGKAR